MLPKMQYSLRCLLFLYLSGVQDTSQPYKASDIDVSAWSVYIYIANTIRHYFFSAGTQTCSVYKMDVLSK